MDTAILAVAWSRSSALIVSWLALPSSAPRARRWLPRCPGRPCLSRSFPQRNRRMGAGTASPSCVMTKRPPAQSTGRGPLRFSGIYATRYRNGCYTITPRFVGATYTRLLTVSMAEYVHVADVNADRSARRR